MPTQFKKNLYLLIVPFSLSLAQMALAQTEPDACASDQDCDDGSTCEKSYYVDACSSDQANCDSQVHESETGTCVAAPVECDDDSDCGEYLACSTQSTGALCWASSDGDYGCEEPDSSALSYCAPETQSCKEDSDCPREFECVQELACPEVACAEGEVCEPLECRMAGGQCFPKQIDCDDDTACPTDWSCIERSSYSCSGGTDMGGDSATGGGTDGDPPEGSGSAAGSSEPVPDLLPEPEAPREDVQCALIKRPGSCQPDAWANDYMYASSTGSTATDNGGGALRDAPEATEEREVAEDDSGDDSAASEGDAGNGCSVSAHGPSAPGSWGWLLLGLPLLLRRRESGASAQKL